MFVKVNQSLTMTAETTAVEDSRENGTAEEENSGSRDHGDNADKDEGEDGAAKTIQVVHPFLNAWRKLTTAFHCSATIEATKDEGRQKAGA